MTDIFAAFRKPTTPQPTSTKEERVDASFKSDAAFLPAMQDDGINARNPVEFNNKLLEISKLAESEYASLVTKELALANLDEDTERAARLRMDLCIYAQSMGLIPIRNLHHTKLQTLLMLSRGKDGKERELFGTQGIRLTKSVEEVTKERGLGGT